MRIQSSPALAPLLVLALCSLSACVDEKIVFEDPTDDPGEVPGAAAGFTGYQNVGSKLTFCGTCHVDVQAEWARTPHAGAWAKLQASGASQASCEGCHSTNQLGNAATAPGGFSLTKEPRFHDVQCEACHGPGLVHMEAPANLNVPRAPLAAGTALTTGCGECHRGVEQPQLEEWAASRHSLLSGFTVNPQCVTCHSGDGAFRAWGVTSDFAEKHPTQLGRVAVTCAVCHDPHGSQHPAGLRFAVNTASLQTNLCMQCHQERPTNTFEGTPHSTQGPVLLGDAGWRPASFQARVPATHGAVASNPGLCVTCHSSARTVKDAAGKVVFRDTGHRFWATPCVDASGRPTSADGCAESQRDYTSCTGSGCHGSPEIARAATARAYTRTNELAAEVAALLARVPNGEFNSFDGRTSVAEGARYNRELALMEGEPVHNPFLIERLLLESIAELKRAYGLQSASGVSLEPILLAPEH